MLITIALIFYFLVSPVEFDIPLTGFATEKSKALKLRKILA